MSTIHIASASQFKSLLSTSAIVVADFYADWCGPCKTIAPLYESLSAKHSSPKKVTFTKVNVDNQQEIASTYGVTAMPTFLIFKSGSVITTLRGADPRALTTAVENAVKLAGAAKPALYATPGHTLGGAPKTGRGVGVGRPLKWSVGEWWSTLVTFFGLYFISLLSLDPYISAERSMFNIHAEPPKPVAKTTARSSAQPARKMGTIADLGST